MVTLHIKDSKYQEKRWHNSATPFSYICTTYMYSIYYKNNQLHAYGRTDFYWFASRAPSQSRRRLYKP